MTQNPEAKTQIEVQLEPRYTVHVGKHVLETVQVPHARVALLADAALLETFAPRLAASLERGGSSVSIQALPAGEKCKTLEVHARLLSKLAQERLTRDAAVVSLGGGAISDLSGYVAASYLRGIAFYAVPTTLLAMVDASVGGKTGVNLPEGKNLVGAFHQPRGVWASLDTLETLPEAIFREGAAETFKHGLIANPSLCDRVLEPGFSANSANLESTVADAIQVKADVVARDPFEAGERAHLNFGHTLAHALEAFTQHQISHGDAVGYGMHYAAILSRLSGGADLTHLTRAFLQYQQPRALPALSWETLEPFMARDKKADAVGVRFVLLAGLGQPKLERVPVALQLEAWQAFCHDLDLP
jgi:3-dehydroquinate synthase